MSTLNKMARLEAQINPETQALLQKAADLKGCSLTKFVITMVEAEAYGVIVKHQVIKLNQADSQAFVESMLNPPQPDSALNAATHFYQDMC
ncbi:DUF1778 domain-containing protein [Thermosynechococcaceae cyanobacterium BACA0444]|uniref:DUF1778 domain-containing protein n=1 Tax=Pseudocalidococcus azoricus BACA0444 TaxID=2918990 RepID=A0AAE4JXX9_9CYAN|nr:DUF1778 domain-containing protein [Pseudocalidococcus azoricus]MDS3861523.1 DUF1778 domain-containing protein [Pseudocalidococcus azoricus BACA0444]